MNKDEIERLAFRFRKAIEDARDAEEFKTQDRMRRFPEDCCDDTAELFIHHLYHEYGIISTEVFSEYYHQTLKQTCGHAWQETEGWVIDLTGDQFQRDSFFPIKAPKVYVGEMGAFHQQFKIIKKELCCGIECLGTGSWERMYGLYNSIMKHMEKG